MLLRHLSPVPAVLVSQPSTTMHLHCCAGLIQAWRRHEGSAARLCALRSSIARSGLLTVPGKRYIERRCISWHPASSASSASTRLRLSADNTGEGLRVEDPVLLLLLLLLADAVVLYTAPPPTTRATWSQGQHHAPASGTLSPRVLAVGMAWGVRPRAWLRCPCLSFPCRFCRSSERVW